MRRLLRGAIVDSSAVNVDFAAVRHQALSVVAGQVMVAIVCALVAHALARRDASLSAWSALTGGGIGAAATLTQVVVGLRNSAGKSPKEVMRGFYRGSAMKFVVTVVLFVLALRGHRLAPAPLFVTYALTFLTYWLALAKSLKSVPVEQGH
jgi:ATP synthase protein I